MIRTTFRYIGVVIAAAIFVAGVGFLAEGIWASPTSEGYFVMAAILMAIGGLWVYRGIYGLAPKGDFYDQYRHPNVFGPGDTPPPAGTKEPLFLPGGIAILISICALAGLQIWLKVNGYGGIRTVIAKFLFG